MKKIVSGLFGLAVVVTGCVRGIEPGGGYPERGFPVLSDDEITLLAERQMPLKLDHSEIERTLDDVRRLLDNAGPDGSTNYSGTRSATPVRTVARIRPMTVETTSAEPTRTGNPRDTLFYIVDFDDSLGYCIIAADRRLPDPIVCFVDSGSFPTVESDRDSRGTVGNPGLAVMLDAVRAYALRSLERRRDWSDSVTTALLQRTGAASLDEIELPGSGTPSTRIIGEPYRPSWHFNRRLGPLLPVEWSQNKPFNTTVVENTQWNSTPVGCVALAAVQVMAYWKHPVSFHGLASDSIDWNELRRWSGPQWNRANGYGKWDGPMSAAPAETQRLVADILWHVGDGIGMKYGASISTAYTSRAVSLLAEVGFSHGRSVKYSHRTVVEQLEAGRPVMIDAASHRSEYGLYANAHAWVIDGFMEDRWWDAYTIDQHFYKVERFRWFLHNNFGWGGTDNGYYAAGVFDTNSAPDFPSSSDTSSPPETRWEGQHYNYQFMQTVYVDIYKQ